MACNFAPSWIIFDQNKKNHLKTGRIEPKNPIHATVPLNSLKKCQYLLVTKHTGHLQALNYLKNICTNFF
jgi:hypothetical protein